MRINKNMETLYKRIFKEDFQVDTQKDENFNSFVVALAELSMKYGVIIHNCTGGIEVINPSDIESIHYSNDYTSGDLSAEVEYKEGEE